jgi:AraC-like DNA-binding protein
MHSQQEFEKHAGTLAKQMIEADFVHPPSLTALAQASGLSPYQMSRLFYRVNHTTIPHYIRKLRTDQAEELLRTTNRAVGQVAAEVGYMSMSAFCRAFVREKGRLPSDMRRATAWPAAAAAAATAASAA